MRRGWIGANVQDLSGDLAEGLSLPNARGALIAHVTAGGPAAKAGLEPGDVVVRLDGKDIADSRVMQQIVVEAPSGRALTLDVMRKGKLTSGAVKVARRQEGDSADAAMPVTRARGDDSTGLGGLGFNVSALTAEMRFEATHSARHRRRQRRDGRAWTFGGGKPASNPATLWSRWAAKPVRSPKQLSEKIAGAFARLGAAWFC